MSWLFRKSSGNMEAIIRFLAITYIMLLLLGTIFSPLLLQHDPLDQDIGLRFLRAGFNAQGYFLGTDGFGRDTLARILYGARVELIVAIGAVTVAACLGTLLGLLGGYLGKYVETLTMRVVVDTLLCFPPIVLALMAVGIYGPGAVTLIVVIGVIFSPIFARIAYGQVLSIKSEEYVLAAKAFGASTWTIIWKEIFPNGSAAIITQISLSLADAILLESGLSYLGLGIVPPTPSWGGMIAEGQRHMASHFEQLLIPSLVLVVTILSFSILGDFLRDVLDPKVTKNG